jgi:hypothetical protein
LDKYAISSILSTCAAIKRAVMNPGIAITISIYSLSKNHIPPSHQLIRQTETMINAANEAINKVLIRKLSLANTHKANTGTNSIIKPHNVVSVFVIESILSQNPCLQTNVHKIKHAQTRTNATSKLNNKVLIFGMRLPNIHRINIKIKNIREAYIAGVILVISHLP